MEGRQMQRERKEGERDRTGDHEPALRLGVLHARRPQRRHVLLLRRNLHHVAVLMLRAEAHDRLGADGVARAGPQALHLLPAAVGGQAHVDEFRGLDGRDEGPQALGDAALALVVGQVEVAEADLVGDVGHERADVAAAAAAVAREVGGAQLGLPRRRRRRAHAAPEAGHGAGLLGRDGAGRDGVEEPDGRVGGEGLGGERVVRAQVRRQVADERDLAQEARRGGGARRAEGRDGLGDRLLDAAEVLAAAVRALGRRFLHALVHLGQGGVGIHRGQSLGRELYILFFRRQVNLVFR